MESRSPLPQAEILQRISEPGSCVSIACTLSKHLKARPAGVAVRRRRIEASILGKKFGPILRALPSSFLGKEPALRESPSYCISHAKHGGSENHKTGPAARRKCTPIPLRGLPPKGEVCSPLFLVLTYVAHFIALLESPPPGETPPQAAEGVHFLRPPGRLFGFIHTGGEAAHHNPHAKGMSNFSPF